jgi:hypothetical protein
MWSIAYFSGLFVGNFVAGVISYKYIITKETWPVAFSLGLCQGIGACGVCALLMLGLQQMGVIS